MPFVTLSIVHTYIRIHIAGVNVKIAFVVVITLWNVLCLQFPCSTYAFTDVYRDE